ncbi:hypothetical protein AVP_156 [Aerococcus phage vB_AviM_AVP]|nr:hypothetical protein AVP_156 [Aerococcus phage vB_AviM_AVP]
MGIVLGAFMGWIVGTLIVRTFIEIPEGRSGSRYRLVWRKSKNYNKF